MRTTLLRVVRVATVAGLLGCVAAQAAPPISYAGGDGSTLEKAVVIKGGNEETGVRAEYTYLDRHFPGYKRGGQSVSSHDKRTYDTLDFTTAKGEKKTVFFDITDFFGKM